MPRKKNKRKQRQSDRRTAGRKKSKPRRVSAVLTGGTGLALAVLAAAIQRNPDA